MTRTARWSTAFVVTTALMAALAGGAGPGVASAAVRSTPARSGPAQGAGWPDPGPFIPAPPGPATGAVGRSATAKPVELSTNWSGYAATSTSDFTSVQGDFIQPSIICTGAPARYMAAWVGLDGFKDKTVEQDGTFATCSGKSHTTPTYVAWYEMYPAGSIEVFPVHAGDEIQPAVTFAGGSFTLTITDVTSGQTQSTSAACKSCRRASAEWIVERPELCTKRGACFLAALPDFATATLSSDTASTEATPAAAAASSFTTTAIDMIQPAGSSVELLDQTGPLDSTGTSFSAQWERAGGKLPL